MEKDIFGQETKILAAAKKTIEEGDASPEAYTDLVRQYGKLLRTTKKIIKLSDKNEQRLNELKQEAQETNTQLEGSSQLFTRWYSGRARPLTVFFSATRSSPILESMESEALAPKLLVRMMSAPASRNAPCSRR